MTKTESKMNISSKSFSILEIGRNSITKRNRSPENPAKIPSAFQEPKIFPVLEAKIPSDKTLGINKWAVWKIRTKAEDNITPNKSIFACLGFLKTTEDISIKRKPAKIK